MCCLTQWTSTTRLHIAYVWDWTRLSELFFYLFIFSNDFDHHTVHIEVHQMFHLSSKLLSLSRALHIPAEFCDFFFFFSINSLPLCISISSTVRGRFFFIESTSAHLSFSFFCRLFDSFEWVFSLFFRCIHFACCVLLLCHIIVSCSPQAVRLSEKDLLCVCWPCYARSGANTYDASTFSCRKYKNKKAKSKEGNKKGKKWWWKWRRARRGDEEGKEECSAACSDKLTLKLFSIRSRGENLL